MVELINHLWQSTVFAAFVALTVTALKRNQARTRCWLWRAASAKFLLPFSVLAALGTRVEAPSAGPAVRSAAVEQLTTTFAPVSSNAMPISDAGPSWWLLALAAIWLLGAVVLL